MSTVTASHYELTRKKHISLKSTNRPQGSGKHHDRAEESTAVARLRSKLGGLKCTR